MEDLQNLLEKINRDGIEKAKAEGEKIIAEAKAKADALVKDARAQAEAAKKDAEKSAAEYAERAAETIREGARDTILKIEGAVTAMLEKLLTKDVNQALADESAAVKLVETAIHELTEAGEITCGAKLAAALKAQIKPPFTVITDETLGTGFSVKTDGGRVEHSFTGAVIAEELAKRLRSDLAKLVK